MTAHDPNLLAEAREHRGRMNYLAGHAAEAQVAADYARRGYPMAAQCWRGAGGEVDLVLHDGDGLVFVEVKKARDFARALERITMRQMRRVAAAAQDFMARQGYSMLTPMRFDVAAVNGHGEISLIENVMFD
ncbi:YraN family protein [Mesobacterium pallidum]|uniref:YraN family protein n=1 Tax=Mesobacterium pallidum TaxID=2872037 RepID=UPI001EE208A5|nr:YraN family protein [Mesobacterium pallidum]